MSVFDLFSIGIGPSSSHTVGPMRAAGRFVTALADAGLLGRTTRVRSELFGSLGATGHGHGSADAVVWGLEGQDPETVDTRTAPLRAIEVRQTRRLRLAGTHEIDFDPDEDLRVLSTSAAGPRTASTVTCSSPHRSAAAAPCGHAAHRHLAPRPRPHRAQQARVQRGRGGGGPAGQRGAHPPRRRRAGGADRARRRPGQPSPRAPHVGVADHARLPRGGRGPGGSAGGRPARPGHLRPAQPLLRVRHPRARPRPGSSPGWRRGPCSAPSPTGWPAT